VVNRERGDYDVKLAKRMWEWMYKVVLNQPHSVVIRETACRRFQQGLREVDANPLSAAAGGSESFEHVAVAGAYVQHAPHALADDVGEDNAEARMQDR
jgi:hypothetical protein